MFRCDPNGLNYRTNNTLIANFAVNSDNELTANTNGGKLTVVGTTTGTFMKQVILFLMGLFVGLGVGSYGGYERANHNFDRELQKEVTNTEAEIAHFNKYRAEDFEAAKPYEASGASGALGALKRLDSNDLDGARMKLAALIAVYYTGHSSDGDTNLLSNIVTLAATDTVLSNAIYRKLPWARP